MSDPQSRAESMDEEELPEDVIPDKFIAPDAWDAGAGADEEADLPGNEDQDIAQERESPEAAEEAAMHVERGNAE